MEQSKELKRIYRIEVQGIEATIKKVEQLNAEINLQTQIKKEAQKILITNPGDVAQIEKQSKVIAESEIAIKKLNAEKRIATKEADAMIKAQEGIANAEARALQTTGLAIGSYKSLYAESKRLNDLYRSTAPTSPLFDKIKRDALEAQQKVHDFNRTLSSEGTLVGEYSRGIINAFKSADMGEILRQQISKGEAAIKQLDGALDILKQDYIETGKAGKEGLDKIEQELIQNRKAALQLQEQVSTMKNEMKSVAGVGAQLSQQLGQGFKGLSKDLVNIAIGFIGIQAAMSGVRSLVGDMKELADQTTNLEIEFQKSAGGVNDLVNGLAKLNTRTKLVDLENIANIAARAGVSEERLLGVTAAIDKVKVAFGKDFGDVEKGTEDIIKLIGIFEGTDLVNEDNILKTGNAIRTLANESTASVPFLTEFSGRVAGLKQIFNLTLPDVLGLASGFEQFKVSSEVAGTAMNTVLPRIAQDGEKFAKLLGLTRQQFTDLINTNPAELFIKVSEALVKTKGGVEQFSTAFKDSELGAGRIANVIGVAGGKAADFRKAIESAGTAYTNTSNIQEAFTKKNENFASVLDKISKKFADLGNNKTLQQTLYGVASAIALILGNLEIFLPLFAIAIAYTNTYAGSLLRLTAAFLLEKGAMVIEAVQLGVNNAIKVTATFITAAYTSATITAATATGGLAVAARILAAAIALLTSPIGIVIGLTAALVTVFGVLTAKGNEMGKSFKDLKITQEQYAAQQRVNAELNERIKQATEGIISQIKLYTAIASDAANSERVRRAALDKLIEISPTYRDALDKEKINIDKLKAASDALIISLQKQARAKAVVELSAEKEKKVFNLENEIAVLQTKDLKSNTIGEFFSDIGSQIGIGEKKGFLKLQELKKDLQNTKEELKFFYETIKNDKDVQAALTDAPVVTTPTTPGDKSKKTAQQIRDERLKLIKEEEEAKKKIEETKFLKGRQDEISYLTNINQITQEYADKKLAIVLRFAKEGQKNIADFQLDKIKSEKETNEKIYKIKQKALDDNYKLLTFVNDPKKSAEENAILKQRTDLENKKRLSRFRAESLLLKNQYHITSIGNEKKWAEEIRKMDLKLAQDQVDIDKAKLEDIKKNSEAAIAKFKADIAARRLVLVEANKSTKQLDKEENLGTTGLQLEAMNRQMPLMKKLFEEGVISAKEYYDFLAERDKLAAQNYENVTAIIGKSFKERMKNYKSIRDLLTGELNNLFNPSGKEGFDFIAEGVVQAFDIAKNAMNDYFNSKAQRIEEEKKYELEKLDFQKEQRLSRAQSQAEEQSIDKQYQKQKQEIERKAFEEAKKLKKSEARLALAAELANIAVQASANPANAATFGAAGLIQFAVLGALAAARYALRVNEINSQKYEKGGWINSGGVIQGPSHAEGGVPVSAAEVEGNELAIVNKRAASSSQVYSVTGTTKQIASAINEAGGGKRFALGAKISKMEYGGTFGKSLANPGDISYLKNDGMLDLIKATNERIDNIKVFVVSKEVEVNNNKLNKAAEINTL